MIDILEYCGNNMFILHNESIATGTKFVSKIQQRNGNTESVDYVFTRKQPQLVTRNFIYVSFIKMYN